MLGNSASAAVKPNAERSADCRVAESKALKTQDTTVEGDVT
jgi:hypothetical protein